MKTGLRERFVDVTRTLVGIIYVLLNRPFLQQGLTVFVFHEVNDSPHLHAKETNTYSDVDLFRRQISWIKESFSCLDVAKETGLLPPQGCLVTFDDGYRGVLSNAVPVLVEYQVPAVCFINVATVQGEINSSALTMFMAMKDESDLIWTNSNPQFFDAALKRLSVEEIEKVREYQGPYINEAELDLLSRIPLITIGDHLNNHWYLESLEKDGLENQIAVGRSKLNHFALDGRLFAAPHGVASSFAIQSLERSGYSIIFSGKSTLIASESTRVYPRIDMNVRIRSRYQLFGAIAVAKIQNFRSRNF